MKIHRRFLLPIAIASVGFLTLSVAPIVKATPYASCVTNNNGTIQFYINESGGAVTVTYEDGSTNANFNGITTGVNLAATNYSFSLAGHSSYNIAVFKVGTGTPAVINNPIQNTNGGSGFFIIGNLRGIDVNKNPVSPNFGRVYIDASTRIAPAMPFYTFHSDGSFWASNNAGIPFNIIAHTNASSPYRIGIAPDDYLMVGDYSGLGAAVYRVAPDLSSGQLFLGPVGDQVTNSLGQVVHGQIFSRPLITGTLTNNGIATLMDIDNDFPASVPNSLIIYTNVTTNSLPYEMPPGVVGPQVGVSLQYLSNVYPGLTQGTNGYIYVSEQRVNYTLPDLYVFDSTGTNQLWTSLVNVNTGPDYFVTSTGNGLNNGGLVDSAVSPDSAYVVGEAIDNHFTIASLTNGIPDVSTIFTVTPTSYAQNARGICWDAADNIYNISSGTAWAQEWTLGVTATAITSGNASGTTNFALVFPSTQISMATTNNTLSQINTYGNPTNTTVVFTRTGDTSENLVVNYTFSGTATGVASLYPASYTVNYAGSVTILAGSTTTNINISALSDAIARPVTTLTLSLSQSPNYKVTGAKSLTFTIVNVAPDKMVATVGSPVMYNAYSNDFGSIILTRWGDTNTAAGTLTVPGSGYNLSGTAVSGTDYQLPLAVTFNPGDLTKTAQIYPLNNGQYPVNTNNKPFVGNKTIIATVANGTGYAGSTNIVTMTIVDSGNLAITVLYSNMLNNAADATNWGVTSANNNMQTNGIDNYIDFGYDLFDNPRDPDVMNSLAAVPIPFPPSGATNALRITVNKSPGDASLNGAAAGVNLYPTNATFSGNYAVLFNMNMPENSDLNRSTEGALFGINHTGQGTNWWSGSGVLTGWGTNDVEAWASDGEWYWVSVDGGAGAGDYLEFTAVTNTFPNTGWQQLGTLNRSLFVNQFKTNVFTTATGPGLVGNAAPDNTLGGTNDAAWSDVEIKQYNNVVTLLINKYTIFKYTNNLAFTNGMLMLGYEDPFSSVGVADGAVYYSNLRVIQLSPPTVTQTIYNKVANTFVFNFTTPDSTLTASSFTVVGSTSSLISGSVFTAVAGATVTSLGGNAYQATVPYVAGAGKHYYRIQQQY